MVDDVLTRANELFEAAKYSEALQAYEAARFERGDRAYQAFIDLNVAQCLRRLGRAKEGRIVAINGLTRAGGTSTSLEGRLLITVANCAADLGDHDSAIEAFGRAINVFAGVQDSAGTQQALIGKSRSYIELQQWDRARTLLEGLLSSSPLTLIIESQAVSNLAVIESRDDPARARSLYERDLEIHAHLDDQHGRAATLLNLAMLEIEQGDESKAKVLLASARRAALAVRADDIVARASRLLHKLEAKQ
jgi:tetratricopeptide (TPR) repeat protein